MAELADATDLKSVSRMGVPVRFRPPTPFYEPLAQQVEQRTFNPFVVGSSPTPGANLSPTTSDRYSYQLD